MRRWTGFSGVFRFLRHRPSRRRSLDHRGRRLRTRQAAGPPSTAGAAIFPAMCAIISTRSRRAQLESKIPAHAQEMTSRSKWRPGNSSVTPFLPSRGHASCLQVDERSFWFRYHNLSILSLVRPLRPREPFLDIRGGKRFVAGEFIGAGVPCTLLRARGGRGGGGVMQGSRAGDLRWVGGCRFPS